MTIHLSQPAEQAMPQTRSTPISRWKLLSVAGGVAVFTTVVATVLWWAGTGGLVGSELVRARFDALRIGLSVGVGGGGLFALYLAWRRQLSTEADLDNRERALAHQEQATATMEAHQDRVATTTEDDAKARRVTDLYAKAVDQLGSDKAPVRLGGLYALERVAQGNPDQRQTIVNVLCAYLRMPYTLPGSPPADNAPDHHQARFTESIQEREVRLTAQRILWHHLQPGSETFWADTDLDLTNAQLVTFDLRKCKIRHGFFNEAQFAGVAEFDEAQFTGRADFEGAQLAELAGFERTQFDGQAIFRRAQFAGPACFESTRFARCSVFEEARFLDGAGFMDAIFSDGANFHGAQFDEEADFSQALFSGAAGFDMVQFTDGVNFNGAQFLRGTPREAGQRFVIRMRSLGCTFVPK